MSFSFSFTAKSRKSAAEKLRKHNIPYVVAVLAEQAIATAPEGILEVTGCGHLANGTTDTCGSHQNAEVKVRSITVED